MIGIAAGIVVLLAGCFGFWGMLVAIIAAIVATIRFGRNTLILIPLALMSFWWVDRAMPPTPPASLSEQGGWQLEVTSMPLSRVRGFIFDAKILNGDATGQTVWVMALGDAPVVLGDRIYGAGSFKPNAELDDGFGNYVASRGASGELVLGWQTVDESGTGPFAWLDRQRQQALARLQNAIPGDAGVLLSGLVTGDDGRLSDEADDAFKRAGLSHLTAVSGANLSAITAMVLAVGAWTGRRRMTWLLVATAAAWTYALAVGLSPPTLRAALVATGATGGRLAGRPVDLLTITLLSGAAQILLRPTDAISISFQLSMMASLGIAASLNRYPPTERRGFLADALLATLYAQIATLPLIVWAFRDLPVLGLFANIVAAPLAEIAFPIGVAGALILSVAPVVGTALLIPAAIACDWLMLVARIYGEEWAAVQAPSSGIWMLISGLIVSISLLLLAGNEAQLLLRRVRNAPPRGQNP